MGTYPKSFVKDYRSFLIAHMFAIDPELEKDQFQRLQPSYVFSILLSALLHLTGIIIFNSIWVHFDQQPITFFSLWSIGNLCLSFIFFLYLSIFFDTLRLLMALCGYQPQVCMKNPLLLSTGPSDFWGRRWNLWVHGQLKRALFTPMFRTAPFNSFSKLSSALIGAFLSFFISGVAHEYFSRIYFFESNTSVYVEWSMLAFFVSQFPICSGEKFLYGILPQSGKKFVDDAPQPVKLLLSYAVILPLAPLFHCSFQAMFLNLDRLIPVIRL